MKKAVELLMRVKDAYPTDNGRNHALVLDGAGRLCLIVWIGGKSINVVYESQDDLDAPLGDIMDQLLEAYPPA